MLVLDGAGWHTSAKVVLPEGIELGGLPPASPERQPAERRWPLVDDPVAHRTLADLDALEAVLVTRCRVLARDRRRLRAHTPYPWWPNERRPRRFAQCVPEVRISHTIAMVLNAALGNPPSQLALLLT